MNTRLTPSRGETSNDVGLIPEPKRSLVFEYCRSVTKRRGLNWTPCVDQGHACYRCQDLAEAALHPQSAAGEEGK